MKINYDTVKSLALLSGAVVVSYAAYRAYKVADTAKTMVTETIASTIKSVSDGFEYAGNLVTGNLPVSPFPLNEAQVSEDEVKLAREIDRVESNRRSNWAKERYDANVHGLSNPMGDMS